MITAPTCQPYAVAIRLRVTLESGVQCEDTEVIDAVVCAGGCICTTKACEAKSRTGLDFTVPCDDCKLIKVITITPPPPLTHAHTHTHTQTHTL